MSIECAIVYIVVSACGVYVAYQLGRAQVYGEWKLWLEEELRKMKDEEVDRNLKAQMVEEMELAVLKNICHCRTLHHHERS